MTSPTLTMQTRDARLHSVAWLAQGVLSFELRPLSDEAWAPVTAGAHIDLRLPGGQVRSYSLVNEPGETHRYVVAVHLDPRSRGGSRWLHESGRVGDVIAIAGPRNSFALREDAPHSVLIGGGIGITPLLCMAQRLTQLRAAWTMHYCARSREAAAFAGELQQLANAAGAHLHFHFDEGDAARRADLQQLINAAPEGSHLYCCGPAPMLQAFESATAALDPARVHREFFAAPEAPCKSAAQQGTFTVKLARSGHVLSVPPGATILDTVLAAGVDVPHSCMSGICRACETRVLDGTPDHQDMVLDAAEQASGKSIIICCSRARSAELTLDL